jgi:hypothetical protein
VAVASDGKGVVSASDDRTIIFWPLLHLNTHVKWRQKHSILPARGTETVPGESASLLQRDRGLTALYSKGGCGGAAAGGGSEGIAGLP